jgi:hypothetical protein
METSSLGTLLRLIPLQETDLFNDLRPVSVAEMMGWFNG